MGLTGFFSFLMAITVLSASVIVMMLYSCCAGELFACMERGSKMRAGGGGWKQPLTRLLNPILENDGKPDK